ncbi:aminoglycoside phosphotransferase family protein [Rugosimonospora africana]|uniref:Aminoglycoside phosphotransferase domain-containing protein n=1 Tax=Rugosimonospora africana TaxID=556532 RepID=A0A8J3QYH0_9ACTN|nr:aminoglycoside phosphotransferase family protein [Rugosimonospora africana]GIH19203.1 hypothetical protein Raf01_73750 [Rugosimonospora africana]
MDRPVADIAIDEDLVARLIEAQHPDLAGPLTLVGNGWDNTLYRLGDDLCVRLPRRRVAAELILNEQRWLPVLAGRLHIPVPVPVRVGVPTDWYPWPWSITRWRAGRPASDLPPHERGGLVADLARFMADLHVPAPGDAPHNPVRGVPLSSRTRAVYERLASGAIPHAERLRTLWDRLVTVPGWAGPPLWLHGDPHPANLLVEHGRLAAVIDFGDLTAGDPATDLAAAWLVFDAEDRRAFRARLDERSGSTYDADTWDRARGWALNMGTAVLLHEAEHPRMAGVGRHTIDQVLRET